MTQIQKLTVDLTPEQFSVIMKGLGELPLKEAGGVFEYLAAAADELGRKASAGDAGQ